MQAMHYIGLDVHKRTMSYCGLCGAENSSGNLGRVLLSQYGEFAPSFLLPSSVLTRTQHRMFTRARSAIGGNTTGAIILNCD